MEERDEEGLIGERGVLLGSLVDRFLRGLDRLLALVLRVEDGRDPLGLRLPAVGRILLGRGQGRRDLAELFVRVLTDDGPRGQDQVGFPRGDVLERDRVLGRPVEELRVVSAEFVDRLLRPGHHGLDGSLGHRHGHHAHGQSRVRIGDGERDHALCLGDVHGAEGVVDAARVRLIAARILSGTSSAPGESEGEREGDGGQSASVPRQGGRRRFGERSNCTQGHGHSRMNLVSLS